MVDLNKKDFHVLWGRKGNVCTCAFTESELRERGYSLIDSDELDALIIAWGGAMVEYAKEGVIIRRPQGKDLGSRKCHTSCEPLDLFDVKFQASQEALRRRVREEFRN